MDQATARGLTYKHYFMMAVLVVGVVTAGLAYHNGFFGGGATTEPATPNADATKGTTP